MVTGDAVELKSATIDASGTNGGLVLIGGDFGGKNPGVPNTQATSIDVASTINAGSTPLGSGGRVSVWGTDEVHFHGNIDTLGGDGGFVEISTHGIGVIDGSAQTLSLLIDPGDVVVSTAGTSGGAPGPWK